MRKLKLILITAALICLSGCFSPNSSPTVTSSNEASKNNLTPSEKVNNNTIVQNSSNQSLNVQNEFNEEYKTFIMSNHPINICENNQNDKVLEDIKSILINDFKIDSSKLENLDIHRSIYEVNLGSIPTGFVKQLIALTDSQIFLFAANQDYSDITFLDKIDDMFINITKADITIKDDIMELYSQIPFKATTYHYVLEWNGIKFKVVNELVSDETKIYYDEKTNLLNDKDIWGLIKLDKNFDSIIQSDAYEEFYTLPKPILKLSNEKALWEYKNKNIKNACKILEYGIEQYSRTWFDGNLENITSEEINNKNITSNPNIVLSVEDFLTLFNNYAFFLSELGDNEKAKSYLLQIIEINPNRTAAYLNLADVEWNLDNHKSAIEYYKKYIELFTDDSSQIPDRVTERINDK